MSRRGVSPRFTSRSRKLPCLNPLHVAERRQPHRVPDGWRWNTRLNPLHVAEGRQPRLRPRLAGCRSLNPLHVAEGRQPVAWGKAMQACLSQSAACRGGASALCISPPVFSRKSQSAACRGGASARGGRGDRGCAQVSIRCMSRRGVSPDFYAESPQDEVSIRCMSRRGVSLPLTTC